MTKRLLLLVTALFALSYGQTSVPVPQAKKTTLVKKTTVAPPQIQKTEPRPSANELTVEQVIQLAQAGLSEDLIIAKIKKNGKAFDLSTEQLLQLKKAGASDNIIRLLMDPQAQLAAPPAPPPATAPSPQDATPVNPTPVPTASPVVTGMGAQKAATPHPDEQGIYWLKDGKELVRVEGIAVSNIRTGSKLISTITGGIKAAKINAQIKGARSEFRMKERLPQFCFYLPEDASIGDYLLLRLAQRLDVRQLEIGQQTFWKNQAGVNQTLETDFTYKRIKARLYLVTPNHELEPGEYGFYIAAGVELKKVSGRIYDFGIDP